MFPDLSDDVRESKKEAVRHIVEANQHDHAWWIIFFRRVRESEKLMKDEDKIHDLHSILSCMESILAGEYD